MDVRILLLITAFTALTGVLRAEDWTTLDGTTYKNVRVVRVEDDAITIIYRDGGALVPLVKLPPALQEKFDYDPVKAKAAADARSKEDAANAKALQAEINLAARLKQQQQVRDAKAIGSTNAP
jgi:hypothetical protein